MTMPEEMFRDTMHRVMENLEIIERVKRESHDGKGPSEVTQLVGSFTMAVGWPREQDSLTKRFQAVSLTDAEQNLGLPHLEDSYKSYPGHRAKPTNLDQFISNIRNAFAHGNVKYRADHFGEIERISIWNSCTCRACHDSGMEKFPTWGTELSVPELRALLLAFVSIADHFYQEATKRGTN